METSGFRTIITAQRPQAFSEGFLNPAHLDGEVHGAAATAASYQAGIDAAIRNHAPLPEVLPKEHAVFHSPWLHAPVQEQTVRVQIRTHPVQFHFLVYVHKFEEPDPSQEDSTEVLEGMVIGSRDCCTASCLASPRAFTGFLQASCSCAPVSITPRPSSYGKIAQSGEKKAGGGGRGNNNMTLERICSAFSPEGRAYCAGVQFPTPQDALALFLSLLFFIRL